MQTEAQQKAAEKNILSILKYLKYLEIFRNTRPGLVDPVYLVSRQGSKRPFRGLDLDIMIVFKKH